MCPDSTTLGVGGKGSPRRDLWPPAADPAPAMTRRCWIERGGMPDANVRHFCRDARAGHLPRPHAGWHAPQDGPSTALASHGGRRGGYGESGAVGKLFFGGGRGSMCGSGHVRARSPEENGFIQGHQEIEDRAPNALPCTCLRKSRCILIPDIGVEVLPFRRSAQEAEVDRLRHIVIVVGLTTAGEPDSKCLCGRVVANRLDGGRVQILHWISPQMRRAGARPALLITRTGSKSRQQIGHHRAASDCLLRLALWWSGCPRPSRRRSQGRCFRYAHGCQWGFLQVMPFFLLRQQGLHLCKSGVSASLSGKRNHSFTQPEVVGCRVDNVPIRRQGR